ncbi:MAG: hypothetical protein MJZ30_11935 [Paludibacteraceae bacterium]|nr:hypothetical protein [Paludibacteraceae bacterium]
MMGKRLVSLLIFLASAVGVLAQDHLKFKGVPLDGTREAFVFRMKSAGFKEVRKEQDVTLLTGEFAGRKDCQIGVSALKTRNLVSRIAVAFPNHSSWRELYEEYADLVDMLTEKYGAPAEQVARFEVQTTPPDDAYRMTLVQLDKCRYRTVFDMAVGRIEVSIEHGELEAGFVMMKYVDRLNNEADRKTAMEDL